MQTLSVGESGSEGESCTAVGIIMHEIGHAIGFFHEQSRPDRDDYVTIHWEHIKPSAYSNFMKYSHSTIDSLGGEYDYDSLMHYSSLVSMASILPSPSIPSSLPLLSPPFPFYTGILC